MAKNKRFWSLLILLLSVEFKMRKLLKTTHAEERSVLTNSVSCNIQLGSYGGKLFMKNSLNLDKVM